MLEKLISYIIETSFQDLPPQVVKQAKRCLIDWVGVAAGGVAHPSTSILLDVVREVGGKRQASVIGTPLKTSILNAALVNGAMSHVLDFDDTHLPALMHPSAPLLPAILAYGEWKRVSGKEFLVAFVVGFEVETRLSLAMGASHYEIGWHSTATMGRFGSSAGVSKLAGLGHDKIANAIGLAGTQVSGVRKVFGTMAKSFHPGKAAADGLLAVLLAERGYTCSYNILEGKDGIGRMLSSDFDLSRALAGLAESYMMMGVSFKPFASCLYTHPAIDAMIRLRRSNPLKVDNIEEIHCNVSPLCMDAACKKDPGTGLEGKFSTPYCLAIALLEGRAGEDLFSDEMVRDPKIREVMQKVRIDLKKELSENQAEVSIRLRDGRVLVEHVDHPLGDPKNPISDSDLEDKARSLLCRTFSKKRVDALIRTLWGFESLDRIDAFTALLRTAPARRK